MENKRIVEINGVKLEVDLRQANTIESFKIGDNIKVLVKGYGDNYSSHVGVIIGFDEFKEHPAINITYLELTYSKAEMHFKTLTADTKDVEIAHVTNPNELTFNKNSVEQMFNDKIKKQQEEIKDIIGQRDYFLQAFGKYFEKAIGEKE